MGRREAQAAPGRSRERIQRFLTERFSVRLHMSAILASCTLAAMLANWALLHAGVGAMLVRYPLAILVAYLTFLLGIYGWLRYVGIGPREPGKSSALDGAGELVDLPIPRGGSGGGVISHLGKGGGTFDGGGASASWSEAPGAGGLQGVRMPAVVAASPGETGGKGAGALGDLGDIGGDEIALLLLAAAVCIAIFIASGYLIAFAPDILSEAAFGALLAGGLARPARDRDPAGWVGGVVRKTWWPFALVLAFAVLFAGYAAVNLPEARTMSEAFAMARAK